MTFRIFLWSLLSYTLVSVLVLGTGIARDQYYWVLCIGWLFWYRSNPIGRYWFYSLTNSTYTLIGLTINPLKPATKPYLSMYKAANLNVAS